MIEKIINIQKTLKAPKGQYNSFGKYNYRSCEDILEAVKPLLAKEGLVQSISDDVILVGDRVYVKATVTVTDGEKEHTVTAFAREAESKKGMDESQITGTASSYARKYALNGMWLIDDTKDADTDEHKNQSERPTRNGRSKPRLTPESPTWNKAITAVASGSYTISQIKAKYVLSPEDEAKMKEAIHELA